MFSVALYARVHFSLPIARETAGAARIRHSLRPLMSEGEEFQEQTSGSSCREIVEVRPMPDAVVLVPRMRGDDT